MPLKVFSTSFSVAPESNATDIFEFAPGVGKMYRIQKIILSGTQLIASIELFSLIKRGAPATGGTFSYAVFMDQGDINGAGDGPACTCKIFTAKPAIGSLLGEVRKIWFPVPDRHTPINGIIEMNFGPEGLIIQGNNYLCGNLNGATLDGGTISVNIEFNQQ